MNFERANKGIAKVVYLCMNEGLDVPKLVHHAKLPSPMHAFSVSNPHLNPCENCQWAKPCENSHKSSKQTPPKKTERKTKNSSVIIKQQSQHVKKIL